MSEYLNRILDEVEIENNEEEWVEMPETLEEKIGSLVLEILDIYFDDEL
jgi:hypothetical protein